MKTGCSFPLHDLYDIRPRLVHAFSCLASPETSLISLGESFFFFLLPALGLHCREDNGTLIQYSCLETPMNGGAWKAAMHGVAEDHTRLSDFTFNFHFHALEKEMANHSIVLAWRIPGMGSLVDCHLWGLTESD